MLRNTTFAPTEYVDNLNSTAVAELEDGFNVTEEEAEAAMGESKYFLKWPPADPALAVCANIILKSDLVVSWAYVITYANLVNAPVICFS